MGGGTVGDLHGQAGHRVRHDWGLAGATAIARGADVAVVVDVLSFTTTLSVAVDAGIAVLPYRWADESVDDHGRAAPATEDVVLDASFEAGWGDDVAVAAEVGSSEAVPVLDGVAFRRG